MDERTLMAGAASGTSLADMADLPVSITVQMDSEQLARYEALLAKLRQRGRREDKAELLLAALETLLDRQHQDDGRSTSTGTGGGATNSERRDKPARGANSEQRDSRARVSVSGPAYQILIQRCPDCEAASVPTSRGDRRISRAQLETALCDAKLKREGERNTSTLPPRVRKRALERDRHRCAMPGCRSRHFLHVHHIRAREDGGTHDLENLVTLCGACHRALHELSKRQQLAALGKGDTVGEPSARYTIAARQAIAELHSSNGNRQQDARL
jgi:5-methylcytosine-specific restriction endonuclease McrA